MQRHLIFDFDGVLADSLEVAIEEINRLVSTSYPELPRINSRQDMTRLYSGQLTSSLQQFGLTVEKAKCFFDAHSQAMRRRAMEINPFNEVLLALKMAKVKGASIVTSCYSDAVIKILRKSPYYTEDLFSTIRGRELNQTKSHKLKDILQAGNRVAWEVLHFGDMVSDLCASKETGIPFCAVGWGYQPLSYISAFNPDFSVGSPKELCHLLKLWQDDTNLNRPLLTNHQI